MRSGLIVFDLDGTLVDSSVDLANAVNAMLHDLGAAPIATSEVVEMVGDGAPVLVRRALSAAGLDPETRGALDSFLAHYDAHLLDHTQPYPGIIETLENLSGRYRLAVLTNKPSHAAELVLIGLHLRRFFRDVVGGDTKWGRKPAPGGLLHLCEQAGAEPDRTVLVGDSPVDLATARNAKARICLARYGFGYKFTGSEFRGDESFIDSPLELPQSPELP